MNVVGTITQAQAEFEDQFHCKAIWCGAAPGRVNLIGGHVDYNDGVVLPLAIDRYTVVVGSTNDSFLVRLFSTLDNEWLEIDLAKPLIPRPGHWGGYIAGVLNGFQQRDVELVGFDAVIHSTVPVGGGLSSSAALEVAMATFLEAMTSTDLSKSDKATLCQRAEVNFAGVPCGIMDQFASVFGETNCLVKIDCRSQEIDLIRWPRDEVSVLVVDSRARHQLVDGKYAERRFQSAEALRKLELSSYRDLKIEQLVSAQEKLTAVELLRARHVVSETQRAMQCAVAIANCDWILAGKLLFDSHGSLRDDYEVSCPELDCLVEIASQLGNENGVFGARMTGGGFGGCIVMLVCTDSIEEISKAVVSRYDSMTGQLAECFATSPARGAFHRRLGFSA
ncbi:galactokinase [bacterium]|nr:galactokinase [bacterium]